MEAEVCEIENPPNLFENKPSGFVIL